MITLIALLLFTIFFLLAGIHIYWGLGGRRGAEAAVPVKANQQPVIDPGPLTCFGVAFFLLCMGIFILLKARIISFHLPAWLLEYGLWIIAGLFIGRTIGDFKYMGLFKKIKQSRFGRSDTKYFSPLCLVIGLLTIFLALLS